MITMKTGSKSPVRFVFSDDVSETTITIQADDASDAIRAKLQRVLELEEPGVRARIQSTGLVNPSEARAPFTAADRAATEARLAQAQPQGWGKDVNIEELPEF
jgi:hypothetical protein